MKTTPGWAVFTANIFLPITDMGNCAHHPNVSNCGFAAISLALTFFPYGKIAKAAEIIDRIESPLGWVANKVFGGIARVPFVSALSDQNIARSVSWGANQVFGSTLYQIWSFGRSLSHYSPPPDNPDVYSVPVGPGTI